LPRALVIGAGAVGEAAVRAFLEKNWEVVATVRHVGSPSGRRMSAAGAAIIGLDLAGSPGRYELPSSIDVAVLTPNLTLSLKILPSLVVAGVSRIIAFSSNNVGIDAQNPIYSELARAETVARIVIPEILIVRPTLIYGDPRQPTVPNLIRHMRRTPVILVPGWGSALVQPVYSDDLGLLAVALASEPCWPRQKKIMSVGGPETFTQFDFFRAVAAADGLHKIVIPCPRPILAMTATMAKALNKSFPLSEAQIQRADKDRIAQIDLSPPCLLSPRTTLHIGLQKLIRAMD
jgi:nucleoside-diphosphate-sugar epimerase